MKDPIPAIAEASATGNTATIFADIREVLGVPIVNLVWRHLATIDGALPWSWSTVRPLYVHGSVNAEARLLRAELVLPLLPAIPSEVFTALGLEPSALGVIQDILAAYDHTNAMALIALTALQIRLANLDDGTTGPAVSAAPAPKPGPLIALPRLPSMADLPGETAALVAALNAFGTRRSKPILASMYRHLGYWPPYLALAWQILAPLELGGQLDVAIGSARRDAQRRAARVLRQLGNEVAPLPSLASVIAAAIEPFVGDVILKMTVICALLRDATRNGAAP